MDEKVYRQSYNGDTAEFNSEHTMERRHADDTDDDVDIDVEIDVDNDIDNDVNYKFWKIVSTIFA